jgi:tRNA pseudouridine38-40 synthase
MKNIKITYQYDGSMFQGFQKQPNKRTVQGELELVLNKILKNTVNLVSAGRTDKGVHALEQVSNFIMDKPIPLEKLKLVLENMLPKDINLLTLEEVDQNFNSRFSAKSRGYKYYITWEKSPFTSKYLTYEKDEIDIEKFQKILAPLVGKHDFSSFRLNDCTSKTTIREIFEIKCKKIDENKIEIFFKGNAFLKSQIRIMVGSALEVYKEKKEKDYIKKMLSSPNKYSSKIVAPPEGLYLCNIEY